MIRLWVLTALLLALALAGCGPDCNHYCAKLGDCAAQKALAFDQAQCLVDCDGLGGDRTHVIDCVIDHSCSDLGSGHCSPTGQAARTF